MEKESLSNQHGAQGNAETPGMSSFSALLNQQLYMQSNTQPFTHEDYSDMSMLLGCTGTLNQPVTQLQFVKLALLLKACFEAQGSHMDMNTAHLCKRFTKVSPAQEMTMLQMDNEYPFKDDQLVSPKDIEAYTNYSDTTVRKKLSDAVCAGLIERIEPIIPDADGNEQLNKKGKVRKQNPRYRWGDVKIIFGDRRLQLLKGRAKRQHEQARELQRKFTA